MGKRNQMKNYYSLVILVLMSCQFYYAQNRVGINEPSPDHTLHVTSSTANDRAINIEHTAATGINYGVYSALSGAATSNYGFYSVLTGAATTNIAGYFSASGGSDNYGLVVPNGTVGIGTSAPTDSKALEVTTSTLGSAGYFVNGVSSGTAYGVEIQTTGGSLTENRGVTASISGRSTTSYALYGSNAITTATTKYGVYSSVGGSGTTNYGTYSDVSSTGTTNVGLYVNATGATNNRAITVPSGGGNVGIGTITPSTTAILDLTSTTSGFLAPRMTTANRDANIGSPATGLLIYNTDETDFQYYTGSAWQNVSRTIKIKSADEGTRGDVTLNDDSDLTFTIGANEVWEVKGVIEVDSDNDTPGFRYLFTTTGTATRSIKTVEYTNDGVEATNYFSNSYNTGGITTTNPGAAEELFLFCDGVVTGGASGGVISLQWAQNISNANYIYVKANSYLVFTRLK